jgi:hypothetical protein
LFSRIDRDGAPLALQATFDAIELQDWPFGPVSDEYAVVVQAFADGGGPIYVSDRHDDYPTIDEVHRQLTAQFNKLRHATEEFVPSCDFRQYEFGSPGLDAFPVGYANSQRLFVLSWTDDNHRYDLIGCLTAEGGSVDALLDGDASWQPPRA